jgi:chemotaxis protein methyltransferase CheR
MGTKNLINPNDLLAIQALVRERYGLTFESAAETKLLEALSARMSACALRLPSAYAAHLRSDASEFQALVNLLTVNETYFFREPEQLRLLVERLIPRRLTHCEPPHRVRLLSAGCSSGEEVYSLLMALAEVHGDATETRFEVIGGDLDSGVLERARAARYRQFSFRGVSEERRRRFFTQEADGWLTPQDWIRRQARFVALNLQAPDLRLGEFDVIFYRNVSLYFDEATRARVLRQLSRLLKPDAYVLVGVSETLSNDLGVLELREEDGLFYFINRPVGAAPVMRMSPPPPRRPPASGPCRVKAAPPDQAPEISLEQLIVQQRFDEALAAVNTRLEEDGEALEARLLLSYLLIERRRFDDAEAAARQALQQAPWLPDAWLLLGLSDKWRQRPEPAIQAFKRALYTQPDCWPVHYYLGDLHRTRGETALARRAWQRVARLLGSEPAAASGLMVPVLEPPQAMILALCERYLAVSSE